MMTPTHLGTLGATQDAADELFDMLIGRNEDLEKEKLGVLADNDALVAENIKLRAELAEQAKQLATMRAA
jgi:hypothetical protein